MIIELKKRTLKSSFVICGKVTCQVLLTRMSHPKIYILLLTLIH